MADTGALTEAARLVAAQPGGSSLLRSHHRPRADGTCGGCGEMRRVVWPCVLVAIATLSDALMTNNAGRMADR